MKKKTKHVDGLRPEYNFDYSKAVRGKYWKMLFESPNNLTRRPMPKAKRLRPTPE